MRYRPLRPKEKPHVVWVSGQTGTGKTWKTWERALEITGGSYDDIWVSNDNLQWMDGYFGQSVAIIDDFRGTDCPFNKFLRILDRYPFRLPFKGGFVIWEPKHILITSVLSPEHAYGERVYEDIRQLTRRIDEVIYYDKVYEDPEVPMAEEGEDVPERLERSVSYVNGVRALPSLVSPHTE